MLVFAVVGLGYPINDGCHAQERSTDAHEQPQPKQSPVDLAPLQDAINRVTGAVEALKDNPEAEAENKRAESDLRAQKDMAKWAFWMFVAASWSVALTLIGVILIWRTLVYTKRAAAYSQSMADAANETADAAKRQAEHSEQAFSRLERPHVLVSNVSSIKHKVVKQSSRYYVACTLGNYGRTPAIVSEVRYEYAPAPIHPTVTPSRNVGIRPILKEGAAYPEPIDLVIHPPSVVERAQPDHRIVLSIPESDTVFLTISTNFQDVLGVHRERRFVWIYDQKRRQFHQYGGAKYNYEREIFRP